MRFKKQRIWMINKIILKAIIPLAGCGVQVIRQDDSGLGTKRLKHAPICGANHYHHIRPITSHCTCGAERVAEEEEEVKP